MLSSTQNINPTTPITKVTRKLPISYALPSILISPASQVSRTTNRLEMSGTVGDIPCKWIIDTGAQCSVITRSLADQAKGDRRQPMFQPHTADGSRLGVSQDLLATIQVGTQTLRNARLTVVDNLAYPAILGMDCLQQLGLSLTLGNDCILKSELSTASQPGPERPHSNQHCPPAAAPNQPVVGLIYNAATVTIPAGCRYVLEATVPTIHKGTTGFIESSLIGCERQELGCGKTVDTIRDGQKVLVQVANPDPRQSVTLAKGTTIGEFHADVTQISEYSPSVAPIAYSSSNGSCRPQKVDQMARRLANESDLNPNEKHRLHKLIHKNSDVFSVDGELGRTPILQHHIPTGDNPPVSLPPRRIPFNRLKEVDKFITEGLQNDLIQPSTSPWAAPLVLVRKPDGSTRFCVDYRKLNESTANVSWPLPRIDDALSILNGAKYFTTLDLAKGYYQVPVAPADQPKTAFTSHRGLYEFKAMPFGLKGAPATFQRLMMSILREENWEELLIYLDDVLIFSKSFEEHMVLLDKVFTKLRIANLKLQPSKCSFARSEVKYIGHVVSRSGVAPDDQKIRAVRDFPCPKSVSEVRRFVGMASWFRRFIKDFSTIAKPLTTLTEKNRPFLWDNTCQQAFDSLKTALSSAPVLAHPDFTKEFVVETDASDVGVGAVLIQDQRPIAFASRALTKEQKNYSATDKELTAVVFALGQFSMFLEARPFTLVTDHRPLIYLKELKNPTGRMARWRVEVESFDFKITHRAGKLMTVADALSRAPLLSVVSLEGNWTNQDLVAVQMADPEIAEIRTWVTTHKKPKKWNKNVRRFVGKYGPHLKIHNGLLKRVQGVQNQVVLPRSEASTVLDMLHDRCGHFGPEKTIAVVKERFLWRGWYRDITSYCRSCLKCLQRKNPSIPDNPPTGNLPVPARPFQWWSIDFQGPLPVTKQGNKYLCVFVDPFSKWIEAFPTPNQTAETTTRLLTDEVFSRYGVAEHIHSDQGKNFEAKLTKLVCDRLGIKKTRSSPYNPRGNGQVERMNRTLAERLALTLQEEDQRDWDLQLPAALAAIRSTENKVTRCSPAYLVFGYNPRTLADVIEPAQETTPTLLHDKLQAWEERLKRQRNVHAKVKQLIEDEGEKRRQRGETKTKFHPFRSGDLVWMYQPDKKTGTAKKLIARKWRGPYRVSEKLGLTTYKLVPVKGGRSKVVNHRLLKPHCDRPPHLQSDVESEDEEGENGQEQASDIHNDTAVLHDLTSDSEDDLCQVEETDGHGIERPQRVRNPVPRLTYYDRGKQAEERSILNDD